MSQIKTLPPYDPFYLTLKVLSNRYLFFVAFVHHFMPNGNEKVALVEADQALDKLKLNSQNTIEYAIKQCVLQLGYVDVSPGAPIAVAAPPVPAFRNDDGTIRLRYVCADRHNKWHGGTVIHFQVEGPKGNRDYGMAFNIAIPQSVYDAYVADGVPSLATGRTDYSNGTAEILPSGNVLFNLGGFLFSACAGEVGGMTSKENIKTFLEYVKAN